MALKDLKVKTPADDADAVKRKAVYLLKTMADTLNSISDTVSKRKQEIVGSLPPEEQVELNAFFAEFKALVLKYDSTLTIKNL